MYAECVVKGYKRIASIPAQIVVDALRAGETELKLDDNITVSLSSNRMQTYIKGVTCVHCGLEGKFFGVERQHNDKHYHLNIYAFKDNNEMMITSDHIVAKALNGSDGVHNRQPMCKKCNGIKGTYASVDEAKKAHREMQLAKGRLKTMAEYEISLLKRVGNYNYCVRMMASGDTTKNWSSALSHANKKIDEFVLDTFGVQPVELC